MSALRADPDDGLGPRLDTLLQRAVRRRRYVRHGLVAVASGDDSWSWQGACGAADPTGTAVTTGMRYPIASVTKLFTAVVTLRLVEQGRLALDDRLVDVLPEDTTHDLHVLDGVDRTGQITVEHLLGHTSGLPDYYEEAPRGQRSAEARLLAGEDAPMPFDEVLRLVRDDLQPHFPPQPLDGRRSKARYTDTNYQLVGAVIERVTGQRLHAVFEEMVFAPLGLTDTSSYPHAPRTGASAGPDVSIWSKDIVLRPNGALLHQVADGGIISTLADQVRFLQALIGGRVFEDPDSWDRMQRRFNRIFFPIEYGLGLMRYAPGRWMSPLFPIPPIIGHSGSTATWLFFCPSLGVVVAGTFDVAQPSLPFRFVPAVLRATAAELT